jgi:hypothetical protein
MTYFLVKLVDFGFQEVEVSYQPMKEPIRIVSDSLSLSLDYIVPGLSCQG